MAQQDYSIELLSAYFPMLSTQQTRTTTGATLGRAPAQQDKPGVAYAHNVMPDAYGYNSVGYRTAVPAFPYSAILTEVRSIFSMLGERYLVAFTVSGDVYTLASGATSWNPVSTPIFSTTTDLANNVTIGTVNGISYLFYKGLSAVKYDSSTNTFPAVTLTALTLPDILGIVASNGYLLAYTKDAIAWSSTIDPTDFAPSEVTGAGGGKVADIAGNIVFVATNTLGLIIYTAANAVAGTYTGNARFPFKFREIRAAKGVARASLVAYEANSDSQFVYSKSGLQAITSAQAEILLPEVTDFLTDGILEDYNTGTNQYEYTSGPSMVTKLTFVASRYLVISYGITEYTHAMIFDISLKKLGKLRVTHVDIFEFLGDPQVPDKQFIAIGQASGEIKLVELSAKSDNSNGVLILGKLQLTLGSHLQLHTVELEGVEESSAFTLQSQVSLTGTSFTVVTGSVLESSGRFRSYGFRATGKNQSLVLNGKFSIRTALVTCSSVGRV